MSARTSFQARLLLLSAVAALASIWSAAPGASAASSCDGHTTTKVGTPGPDVIDGKTGPDVIKGRGGNDIITGLGGRDRISEGPERMSSLGGNGNDRLFGRSDNDTIIGDIGADDLFGFEGTDTLFGDDDRDFLSGGEGPDTLFGGAANDKIRGGPGDDAIDGGPGDHDICVQDKGGNSTSIMDCENVANLRVTVHARSGRPVGDVKFEVSVTNGGPDPVSSSCG